MIKVNIVNLKNELEKLDAVLEEYENIELNLFNQVKNSCNDWHDPRTPAFTKATDKEKKESGEFLDSFKDVRDCLNYIIMQYENIGIKIKVLLENKNAVIKSYGNIEKTINNIISKMNSVDFSFYYSEKDNIRDVRDSFEKLKVDVAESREKVRDLFVRVERIEENVKAKLRSLNDIRIVDFDYVLDY